MAREPRDGLGSLFGVKVRLPAAFGLALAVTACGSSPLREAGSATPATARTAAAHTPAPGKSVATASADPTGLLVAPPHSPGPCADYAPPSLAGVRSDSDIAVVGHISRAPFRTVSFGSYYSLDVSQVVESRLSGPPPRTLAMLVLGPVVPDLFPDDEYVAFLFADRPLRAVDPSLGRPSYQWSDGWLGLFPVRGGRVYPECPAAESLPGDRTGVRPGETLASFLGRLRSRPQPPKYGRPEAGR